MLIEELNDRDMGVHPLFRFAYSDAECLPQDTPLICLPFVLGRDGFARVCMWVIVIIIASFAIKLLSMPAGTVFINAYVDNLLSLAAAERLRLHHLNYSLC
jgi:hypothetical protein